jgi:hypothetical protein
MSPCLSATTGHVGDEAALACLLPKGLLRRQPQIMSLLLSPGRAWALSRSTQRSSSQINTSPFSVRSAS